MAKKTIKTAKKAVKKTVKKAAPAKKKVAKKAAKNATKKAAPKKKASKKAAPVKAAKKKVVKKAAKKAASKAEPKTNTIGPYLNFAGNCEEAFDFYKAVFGGNFTYKGRFNEMPPQEGQPPMPESAGTKIMHVSLPISKETALMGSDCLEGFGPPVTIGNNFSVSINAKSESEADRLYSELSAGGDASMPMSKTFWGSYFGMLTDKFGISWQISAGQ
ncbi:MAG: VOC family protein [Bacteroidota bacterium]